MTGGRLAVPASSFKLNPFAEEFKPKRAQPAEKWAAQAYAEASQHGGEANFGTTADQQAGLRFMDVPSEILASILGCLDDPSHVAAAAITCKRLRELSKSAPLHLRIAPCRFMREDADGVETLRQDHLRAFLTALCAQLKGVDELSLRKLPVELEDLEQVKASLPQLRILHLSEAQKLPSDAVSILLAPHAMGGDKSAGLRAVSFVRCFQMTHEGLDAALAAAAGEGSGLRMVAFSHLDLSEWREGHNYILPQDRPAPGSYACALRVIPQPVVQLPPAGSLQILSLHNCNKFRSKALLAIAEACPQLRMLMLGGCSLALTPEASSASMTKIGEAMRHMRADRSGRSNSGSPLRVIGIVDEGQYIPSGANPASGLQLLKEAVQNHGSSRGMMTAASCAMVAQLSALVAQLPCLQVLELTHHPHIVVDGARVEVQRGHSGGRPAPGVWDLCRPEIVRAAQAFQEGRQRGIDSRDVALALQEAVNCSSQARQTPLHAAAELGDAAMVKALLDMGAAVNARDKSGGTPLAITAEERGRGPAAAALLVAGADVRAKNAAGEAPLYIAALRGHHDLVQLLLAHHELHNIAWTAPGMYGDGWTPLMACCVAGHLGIARVLLERAGPDAHSLVLSANRYGLTAGHIAARRGDLQLLMLLLQYAGRDVSKAKDSNGETPIIVAAKYKHASAVQLLTDALVFPKAPWGGHLPTPYNLGGHMPSKRQSLKRPACH